MTLDSEVDALRRVPLFRGIDATKLRLLYKECCIALKGPNAKPSRDEEVLRQWWDLHV